MLQKKMSAGIVEAKRHEATFKTGFSDFQVAGRSFGGAEWHDCEEE